MPRTEQRPPVRSSSPQIPEPSHWEMSKVFLKHWLGITVLGMLVIAFISAVIKASVEVCLFFSVFWACIAAGIMIWIPFRFVTVLPNEYHAVFNVLRQFVRYIGPGGVHRLTYFQTNVYFCNDQNIRLNFKDLPMIKTSEMHTLELDGYLQFRFAPTRASPENWVELLQEADPEKLIENAMPIVVNAIQIAIQGVPDREVVNDESRQYIAAVIESSFLPKQNSTRAPLSPSLIRSTAGNNPTASGANAVGLVFEAIVLSSNFAKIVGKAADEELAGRFKAQKDTHLTRKLLEMGNEPNPTLKDVQMTHMLTRGGMSMGQRFNRWFGIGGWGQSSRKTTRALPAAPEKKHIEPPKPARGTQPAPPPPPSPSRPNNIYYDPADPLNSSNPSNDDPDPLPL